MSWLVGLDCRLEGDGEIEVSRVESLDRAGPSDLSFFANPLYATALENTRAAAVILDDSAPDVSCATLRSQHPYLTFAKAVELFADPVPAPEGVDSRTVIASDALLAEDVAIGPFVSVGAGTSIGAATTVYPHVVIGRASPSASTASFDRRSRSESMWRSGIGWSSRTAP